MRLSASEPPEKTESDHINISKSQNLELLPFPNNGSIDTAV